jgi:hypothetical protein
VTPNRLVLRYESLDNLIFFLTGGEVQHKVKWEFLIKYILHSTNKDHILQKQLSINASLLNAFVSKQDVSTSCSFENSNAKYVPKNINTVKINSNISDEKSNTNEILKINNQNKQNAANNSPSSVNDEIDLILNKKDNQKLNDKISLDKKYNTKTKKEIDNLETNNN